MKETNFKLKLFGIPIISIEIKRYTLSQEQDKETLIMPTSNRKKETSTTNNLNAINNISNGTIRPDLKELERKVLNIEEVPKPVKIKCGSCDGITYDDDIDFCIRCGKDICSNCGSIDTDGKKYCADCWTSL